MDNNNQVKKKVSEKEFLMHFFKNFDNKVRKIVREENQRLESNLAEIISAGFEEIASNLGSVQSQQVNETKDVTIDKVRSMIKNKMNGGMSQNHPLNRQQPQAQPQSFNTSVQGAEGDIQQSLMETYMNLPSSTKTISTSDTGEDTSMVPLNENNIETLGKVMKDYGDFI